MVAIGDLIGVDGEFGMAGEIEVEAPLQEAVHIVHIQLQTHNTGAEGGHGNKAVGNIQALAAAVIAPALRQLSFQEKVDGIVVGHGAFHHARIEEVLEQVGMGGKGYKMPNELSGGEQQRIVIARAILNKPELILADEPTGNLDVETGRKIVELLRSICQSGSTVIMTTHNLNLLTEFPGKVYKFENHHIDEITEL